MPRLIFAAAGIEFDDNRISKDDWYNHKQNSPFGQVPYLEIIDFDGSTFKIGQSMAIGTYKVFKLEICA